VAVEISLAQLENQAVQVVAVLLTARQLVVQGFLAKVLLVAQVMVLAFLIEAVAVAVHQLLVAKVLLQVTAALVQLLQFLGHQ
jgi:hypothetical protein